MSCVDLENIGLHKAIIIMKLNKPLFDLMAYWHWCPIYDKLPVRHDLYIFEKNIGANVPATGDDLSII
jgi:hypothetical protein